MTFPEGDLTRLLPLTQQTVQDDWATTTSFSCPRSDGVSRYAQASELQSQVIPSRTETYLSAICFV